MAERKPTRRREVGRGERVLPGVWRLRLPLPWPGVPHCNAWALAAGDGIVLVDTGMHEPGLDGPPRARARPGGAAARPDPADRLHARAPRPLRPGAGDPPRAPAPRCGSTPTARTSRRSPTTPSRRSPAASRWRARPASPRRRCALGRAAPRRRERDVGRAGRSTATSSPASSCDTDLGDWHVIETPGHAPSHVCLHQPERRLLISGDHLLGRVSPYFDQGHTPDPVGEFLDSLDKVDALDARLCLAGHGRPFTDVHGHVEANRAMVAERLEADARRARRGRGDRVRAHPPPGRRRARRVDRHLGAVDDPRLADPPAAARPGARSDDEPVVGGLNFGW